MDEFLLDKDDVVAVTSYQSPTGVRLCTFQELMQAFRDNGISKEISAYWFSSIDGQVLKTSGGGWQRGKFRLRLEFIPNPQEPSS